MEIEDQSETVAFLKDPQSYGGCDAVEELSTHISRIFLTGDRAYKLKRAVRLPYADFSTYALREAACRRELDLNRRSTPELYLGLRLITRAADGRLAFDGEGEPVDAVVEMARFSQDALLDRLADRGELKPAQMEALAQAVSTFHASATPVYAETGSANLAAVLSINEAGFATSRVFDPARIEALCGRFRDGLALHAPLLDRRGAAGRIRLCHGDLHLRNIFLGPEGPRLFDCIDFNDRIATVDVLYDLAFLLMDLDFRGLHACSNQVMNRYLDRGADEDGLGALPYLMAVRAAVRAHVTGTQIAENGDPDGRLTKLARDYFDFAERLLTPRQPRLIAIGGLSGTGKSTLAEGLAPRLVGAPGVRILESDRLRKAMFSVPLAQRLPQEAYRPEVSAAVYESLDDRALQGLESGGAVIVNAVFERSGDRDAIEAIARKSGCGFIGIWLEARSDLLIERVRARPQGASDATTAILQAQLAKDPGPISWHHLDCSGTPDQVRAGALALIEG